MPVCVTTWSTLTYLLPHRLAASSEGSARENQLSCTGQPQGDVLPFLFSANTKLLQHLAAFEPCIALFAAFRQQ